MSRVEQTILSLVLASLASPALAGTPTPAPVAGIGVGAVLLIGLGYRTLKGRTKR